MKMLLRLIKAGLKHNEQSKKPKKTRDVELSKGKPHYNIWLNRDKTLKVQLDIIFRTKLRLA